MSPLPDPTVDLDWSGYAGSIQEKFYENAKKHPDRICVVETKSSKAPERSFTYRQIWEASNTLAHFLHDNGITNDDVVMIWAHRSVDLVVSIMGTLVWSDSRIWSTTWFVCWLFSKASGATFSVLDPAYPPARQIIYLEVAQPRALINIGRATDEAGQLATVVRKFIDEELQLKAEVPSLRIQDSGLLSGVEVGQTDIFAGARAKASIPLLVRVFCINGISINKESFLFYVKQALTWRKGTSGTRQRTYAFFHVWQRRQTQRSPRSPLQSYQIFQLDGWGI